MELDVHLSRAGTEPWGFRLVGGVDFNMPLTVAKVIPNSPADHAGLKHGDAVSTINGADASKMAQEDAKGAVASAAESLMLGITRGLYDPVLDDYEPIYESIDQDDFDQPSQPTEVQFHIKDFTDTPVNFDRDSRSLTESPFVLSTKPYRPFSTEPLPVVPPLEDPIILNPNYHDEFGQLVDGAVDGVLLETRFKLPISDQYDPDGTRKAGSKTVQEVAATTTTVDETSTKTVIKDEKKEVMIKEQREEIQYLEKMKKEIDLDKIEMTATSIVDESIQKAITVADDIRKEIDVALTEVKSEVVTKSVDTAESKKSILKKEKKESTNEVNELIAMIDQTTDVIMQNNDISEINVSKEVAKFESLEKQETNKEQRKVSIKQELEDTIISGIVKKQSEMFDKQVSDEQVKVDKTEKTVTEKKLDIEVKESEKTSKSLNEKVQDKTSFEATKTDSKVSSEKVSKTIQNTTFDERKSISDTKYTTSKLLAEQRAHIIGLQTIPHIKGSIQSSYHYDLLLKTFFIHLTDVMVALSRFILAEPVLSKPLETKLDTKKETVAEKTEAEETVVKIESVVENKLEAQEDKRQEEVVKKHEKEYKVVEKSDIEEKAVQKLVVDTLKVDVKDDILSYDHEKKDTIQESLISKNEMIEKRMLSGSEMAQLSEKKSEELTNKMEAVITEFVHKAGIEEEVAILRERRSRSRSKIEEEVSKESDPLEWLSKVDSQKTSQERIESKTTNEKIITDSMDMKKSETTVETSEVTTSKSKEGKNMYIAIVESHVYTNKNAILDEISEISETASVQSAEEINLATESSEAFVIEQVSKTADSNQIVSEVSMESHEESKISAAKTETAVHIAEETKEYETVKETAIQESSVQLETMESSHVEIQETVETAQPIVELHEDIVEKTQISLEIAKESIDIQEIHTSEMVGELSVIKEEKIADTEIQIQESAIEVRDEMKLTKEEAREIVKEVISEEMAMSKTETTEMLQEISEAKLEEVAKVEIESKVMNGDIKRIIQNVESAEETISKDEEISKVVKISDAKLETTDEFAQLKVTKEEITEIANNVEINEEINVNIKKSIELSESSNKYQSFTSESIIENYESQDIIQESSFTAKVVDTHTESLESKKQQLTLDIPAQKSLSGTLVEDTDIKTPTPSTVPPTPLTDEYVFRLQMPLPKLTGEPVLRSPSPEDEDPNIVKKKLIPHIDSPIIEEVIFDPPLPTPPEDKVTSPVYTKPGLKGGAPRHRPRKEEILEIERKSSLLASAIDQTIKSIEEYKEEVGIDTKTNSTNDNIPVIYNGYAKVIETKIFNVDELKSEESKKNNNIELINSENTMEDNKVTVDASPLMIETKVDSTMQELSAAKEMEQSTEGVQGYRPVSFNPDDAPHLERVEIRIPEPRPTEDPGKVFITDSGDIMGTHQGIVDGLEEAMVDSEVVKELGKPGMTEEKIAELISGESEMLREAHVMGLTRVLKSHMHRANDDDSSVDFKKIKPIVESLKDSEVLKALNEEFTKTQAEKKKDERKWTKFLQKPSRPVPKFKSGHYGFLNEEETVETPYKVKIVKQPKPKVAPDYKPEDFETGPLPWEQRALTEPPPPPVEAEDPILVPEELPEFLEAVDPLPESEVPDLEETGIPLPPEPKEEPKPQPEVQEAKEIEKEELIELKPEIVEEEKEKSSGDMEQNRIAEQLITNVQSMVDPNAPLEQQLSQMRAQLAALAQLPGVIQQTLELVTRQLCQISQQESTQAMVQTQKAVESSEVIEETQQQSETIIEEMTEETEENITKIEEVIEENGVEEVQQETKQAVKLEEKMSAVSAEEMEKMKREEEEILGEQRRIEKQKKELMAELQLDQESRQLKQRPTPRVGKPKPVFGPLTPQERPVVLPGGRRWRKPADAYNEQFIAETLTAQAELIQGKAMGKIYESVHLPYDERVNFMKYEKPPVSLDHLQHSDVYKLIHNMEDTPMRRVDMLTPVIAEADYREKCRSVTPCADRTA